MLLQCLHDFAHSRGLLDDLAFAPKSVRWVMQLDREGHLIGAGPIDTSEDGKHGKEFLAPLTSRPKNAGGIAEFLADGITALFGLDAEPEKDKLNPRKRQERDANNAAKCDDFWRQIQQAFDDTQHWALAALLTFHHTVGSPPSFLRWGVSAEANISEQPAWWLTTARGEAIKLKPANFTYQVESVLLLEDEMLRAWWRKGYTQELGIRDQEAKHGLCLITGHENVPIAATHLPKIKGVPRAQPTGAALVSFDKPAFTSYGFEQSHNAPASTEAATAYCVALNHLLESRKHSLRVGPMAVCFWGRDSEEATDVFSWAFEQPKPENVREFLRSPSKGSEQALAQPDEFCSATLSGNGGRIVVRHWMQMPITAAIENVRRWFEDLDIVAYDNGRQDKETIPPLALFRLACTTVREAKDLQTDVPGQLYRAALEGISPPLSLLKPILTRFEVDLVKNGPRSALRNLSRFALLRLLLNRNNKEGDSMIAPQLCETDDPAYNCGRLLAIFDDLQMRAHEYQLEGAGVVERYYGSASSAPNSAFGILWRLHQHHLKKLSRQSDRGKAAAEAIKRKIAEISTLFPPPAPRRPPAFPRTFNLQEQGRFALGFYQQKAADEAARRSRGEQHVHQNEASNQ